MKIIIETINHADQAYPTVGNYWMDEDGVMQIRVSKLNNPFYEGMIAVHELVEWLLCIKAGIPEKEITDFDLKFEAERKEGNFDEPGFEINAPYYRQHCFATSVELGMCAMAGEDFKLYDKTVNELT